MARILLCNPPTGKYIRGEQRCQAAVDESLAISPRMPIELAYMGAILQKDGHKCRIRDYPLERKLRVFSDISQFAPDIVIITTTFGTFHRDIEFLKSVKNLLPDVFIIANGVLFRNLTLDEFKKTGIIDAGIFCEPEFVIAQVATGLLERDSQKLRRIGGIVFRQEKECLKMLVLHLKKTLIRCRFRRAN